MGLNSNFRCPECNSIEFKVIGERLERKRTRIRVCYENCSRNGEILEVRYK